MRFRARLDAVVRNPLLKSQVRLRSEPSRCLSYRSMLSLKFPPAMHITHVEQNARQGDLRI